ncbi:MAG: hypothetical protein EPN91_08950 [Salinibacterium sp.]|nr:MAG: hypothetical protein EPN91_08950 [Salinibacterium sp.]
MKPAEIGNGERAKVRLAAANAPTMIVFEPIGWDISLEVGEEIFVDLPLSDLSSLEIVVWETGLSVWLPYTGDQFVLDKDGREIEPL